MGWGDEIMVTGDAIKLGATEQKPLVVMGKNRSPRWHTMWDNNPIVYRPPKHKPKRCPTVKNHPGCRPYCDYERIYKLGREKSRGKVTNKAALMKLAGKWFYTGYKAKKGKIYFSGQELKEREEIDVSSFVIIEPNLKARATPNKNWGFERYQKVVDLLPEINWVQIGQPGARLLRGVTFYPTKSFRYGCIVMSKANGYLGPEGGLHHAAAALDVKAVVIFGSICSPDNTGYDFHHNLYVDDDQAPCGMRTLCDHCMDNMASILPEQVAEQVCLIL